MTNYGKQIYFKGHANRMMQEPEIRSKWLVETELASISRRARLYSTNSGQIVAKMLGGFSENYFTKMMISRDPVDRFCWEAVNIEINVCSFRSCEREVWESFSRGEWPGSRFGVMMLSLEFCSLARRFPCFFDFDVSAVLRDIRSCSKDRKSSLRMWLVETELADTLVEQYTKEITAGKSWRKCKAHFPKYISQKWWYLAILSTDFAETLSKWG